MKWILKYLTTVAFFLMILTPISSEALLIMEGTFVRDDRGTASDNSDDLLWLRDLSLFNNRTYEQQISEIGVYSAGGIDAGNWRMATPDDFQSIMDLPGNYRDIVSDIFLPSLVNDYYEYWLGRIDNENNVDPTHLLKGGYRLIESIDHPGSPGPWELLDNPDVYNSLADNSIGAWVVADALPASPVPEPSTITLLGISFSILYGYSTKKKKKINGFSRRV